MIPIQLLGLSNSITGQRRPPRKANSTNLPPQPPPSPLARRKTSESAPTTAAPGPTIAADLPSASTEAQEGGVGSLKDGVSFGMDFIKRRFSSSDNIADDDATPTQPAPPPGRAGPPPAGYAKPDQSAFNLSGLNNSKMTTSTISAPSSPARSQGSMYSQVQGLTRGIFQAATGAKPSPNSPNTRVLLVIDDHLTDWSKYFRNARIGDWEVLVEQADFPEIRVVADSVRGASVTINTHRLGNPVVKTFRPDFVLIRQPVKTASADYRKVVTGLLFGGVPSLNSLHSIYNFIDKPWVFAHLLMIQKRLGREKFPLIEQIYYPTTQDVELTAKLPAVLKVGTAQKGVGKMRVTNPADMADIGSVVSATGEHATLEPFVDAKYDIHVQKIGTHYKAFMRKGISGHWKANQGSSMLEQIAMTDRYRLWVDEVAGLFGGLEVCSVEGLVGRDGSEVVYEANDSCFSLLGETQEEDRRHIADLLVSKMTAVLMAREAAANGTAHASPPQGTNPFLNNAPPVPPHPPAQPPATPPRGPPPPRPKRQPSLPREPPPPPPTVSPGVSPIPMGTPTTPDQARTGPGGEDTMGQLRKTFAGIFGDM